MHWPQAAFPQVAWHLHAPVEAKEVTVTTRLNGPLKRAIDIGGQPYTLTITPEGLRLVPKGRRNGYELAWSSLVSGEAALATALNASVSRTHALPDREERG